MDEFGETLRRVGESMRSLREDRGLTQEGLAKLAGIDRTFLAEIESGKQNVSVAKLAALAGALKFPLARFFHADAPAIFGVSAEYLLTTVAANPSLRA